ncbi:MAG TPA: GNAT family N-acetyltransferase, partial [Limnochordia bacterium]|nr:GNAT family N-acetyltransferase [Limnochordia bacterium]
AVERSREIKPEIPLLGVDGIPIRDEIELVKILK